ncbi:MAG: hypothetical protein ABSG59_18320 [Verrucomicrobiota bacterium]|jgi:hypothetical protein
MKREEEIRKEILFQLYAVRPLALTPDRISRDATKQRYDYTASDIRREAEFLADENLIVRVNEPGTTAVMYRIHAAGVRHYEQNLAA